MSILCKQGCEVFFNIDMRRIGYVARLQAIEQDLDINEQDAQVGRSTECVPQLLSDYCKNNCVEGCYATKEGGRAYVVGIVVQMIALQNMPELPKKE